MSSRSTQGDLSPHAPLIQWEPQRLDLAGRRTEQIALLYGVVPPAAGPARVDWCLEEGQAQYRLARQQLGRAMLAILPLVPGGLQRLPGVYELHSLHLDIHARRDVGRQRVREWFSLREEIETFARHLEEAAGIQLLGHQWSEAAETTRGAVDAAATAYHCLQAALVEARSISENVGGNDDWATLISGLTTDVANAHALVHRIGELLGGLFGCKAEFGDQVWMRRCPVDLMHYAFGLSAGYTARHLCSICNNELAQCPHLLGIAYDVEVGRRSDGSCNVCDLSECEHEVGTTAKTVASPEIADATIHEISITPRPRDPRARLTGVEVPIEVMKMELGVVPSKDAEIWHHQCIYPCDGLFRFRPTQFV